MYATNKNYHYPVNLSLQLINFFIKIHHQFSIPKLVYIRSYKIELVLSKNEETLYIKV